MTHSVGEGKYTLVFHEDTGRLECLRYGKPWRNLAGDGMALSMLYEIDELKAEILKLKEIIK